MTVTMFSIRSPQQKQLWAMPSATLVREALALGPPVSHSRRRPCKPRAQKFAWHLEWTCCFPGSIRLALLALYCRVRRNTFVRVSLLFSRCLQELHRAALRHDWVKGGHCHDSAPLQDYARSHQAAYPCTQDSTQTQEWALLILEKNFLMLEPRLEWL